MDVGTVLAAVGSSTVIATFSSAIVSWKIASRQQQVEKDKLQHEREKHAHEKAARKRDDARKLCQQVIDELTFMDESMHLLHDNWRFWKDSPGDEETRNQAKQIYDDVTKSAARMPRLLSDLFAAPADVLSDASWTELREHLLRAQQTYGHIVLDALNPGEYPDEAWRHWLIVYGKANMTARHLIAEIG